MNTTEFKKLRLVIRNQIIGMALNNSKWNVCIKAANLAEEYHTGYRKDNITPEIYHQYSMVGFFLNLIPMLHNVDEDFKISIVVTLFLHDTIEDYKESEVKILNDNDLKVFFNYIENMSKEKDHGKISNVEYYRNLSECIITTICKGIDRIHNLSTIHVLGKEKTKDYITETKDYVLPLIKEGRNNYPEYIFILEHLKSVLNILCEALNEL